VIIRIVILRDVIIRDVIIRDVMVKQRRDDTQRDVTVVFSMPCFYEPEGFHGVVVFSPLLLVSVTLLLRFGVLGGPGR